MCTVQACQNSVSQYLFDKQMADLQPLKKQFGAEKVDRYLETMMKVNIAFLSKAHNDGFCLIDPAAFNNQCHMYALFAYEAKKKYKSKTMEDKLAQNQENRFLHLSFLLSYAFIKDSNVMVNSLKKELLSHDESKHLFDDEKSKTSFTAFVKDSSAVLRKAARKSLNEVFKELTQEALRQFQETSPLNRELYQLSLEDLELPADGGGKNAPSLLLYTLPKLVGIAYLIQQNVSYVIKTKVITEEGTESLMYKGGPEASADDPVLVFEGISSEILGMSACMPLAHRCNSYYGRNSSGDNRHKTETCLFCNVKPIETKAFDERIQNALKNPENLFYALAADFMQHNQKKFLDREEEYAKKFPLVVNLFKQAQPNVDLLGLSIEKPLALTIDHVHVDSAENAFSANLRMNHSPEQFMTMRGFL